MKIYLDFDGTVVEHDYPRIGRCNFGCIEVIKKLQDAGHEIVINTMRSEFNDGSLQKALDWVVNSFRFSKDRSASIGPFESTERKHHPPYWDWDMLDKQFIENGIYEPVNAQTPGE